MALDQIRFVQFLHPGGEHRPEANGWKPWNTGQHRRTFVVQPGSFLRRLTDDGPEQTDLHFWCEWECEAEAVARFDPRPGSDYARFLFRPWIRPRTRFITHATTDPCVFGSSFRYCVCQQPSHPSLRTLAPGSVILFGSHSSGAFVIDTVFVAARSVTYNRRTHRRLRVPRLYHNAAIAPLFGAGCYGGSGDLRLYEGATPDDPVEGMFSFFPCLPAEDSEGFARPAIRLPGVVNPRLMRGIRRATVSLPRARELWGSVAKQVLDRGLCLGVAADFPRVCRAAIPSATSRKSVTARRGC